MASHQTSSNQISHPDYHGHPNYFMVWVTLLVVFFISLGLNELGHRALAVTLIFTLAIVKAILVLGNFMHLRWEPRLLWGILVFAVLCLAFLYFGVAPDLLWVDLKVAK